MISRYEYLECLPSAVYGGFRMRDGQTATITQMGFIASRNGQEGDIYLHSVLLSIRNERGRCI